MARSDAAAATNGADSATSGAAQRPFGAIKTASCGGGTGHPLTGSAGRDSLEHAICVVLGAIRPPLPRRSFGVLMHPLVAADLAHTPRSDTGSPRGPAPPPRPAPGRSGSAGLGRDWAGRTGPAPRKPSRPGRRDCPNPHQQAKIRLSGRSAQLGVRLPYKQAIAGLIRPTPATSLASQLPSRVHVRARGIAIPVPNRTTRRVLPDATGCCREDNT